MAGSNQNRRPVYSLGLSLLCVSILSIPTSAKVLEVGIEHSEMLSPLPDELQPGSIFHKRHAEPESDRWSQIPLAAAGKWKLIRKFDVSSVDLRNGKRNTQLPDKYDNSITYIGYQSDARGDIWTSADIESKLPHSNGTYLVPAQWDLKLTSDHSFTVLKRGVSITVDPENQRIQESRQLESFASFDVVGPNKLLQKYSTQWFDARGEAIKLTEGQTEMEKIGDFKPINELNGIDVKSSFRHFQRR